MISWIKNKFAKREDTVSTETKPKPVITEGRPKTNVKRNNPTPRPSPPPAQKPGKKSKKKSEKKASKKIGTAKKAGKKSDDTQLSAHLRRKLKNKPELLTGMRRDASGELLAELSKPYADMTPAERQLVGMQAVSLLLQKAGQR